MSYTRGFTIVCWLQTGAPAEEDLKNWGQHTGAASVPDEIMQRIGDELPGIISFVFTCQVMTALQCST